VSDETSQNNTSSHGDESEWVINDQRKLNTIEVGESEANIQNSSTPSEDLT